MGSPGQEAPLARSAAATSEAAFAKILSNFDDVRDSATAPDQEGTRSVAPAPAGANSVAQARSAQELMPYTFRVKRLSFFLLSLCIPLIKVLGAVTLPQEALNFLFVVFIIIWWIVLVGRFHDAGHSGAWSLLMLLPLVNVLVFLYILFTPSAEPRFSLPTADHGVCDGYPWRLVADGTVQAEMRGKLEQFRNFNEFERYVRVAGPSP
jgi:hypothetical protein